MNASDLHNWKGFLLVRREFDDAYRGIDRPRFEPVLLDDDIEWHGDQSGSLEYSWEFVPPGWKRDAYKLFEENLLGGVPVSLQILRDESTARTIQRAILPHIGVFEIIECESVEMSPTVRTTPMENYRVTLGYDVAYPGGDFYSAVANGLFRNADPQLVAKYSSLLNGYGLFPNTGLAVKYLQDFKNSVPSESESTFVILELHLVQDGDTC